MRLFLRGGWNIEMFRVRTKLLGSHMIGREASWVDAKHQPCRAADRQTFLSRKINQHQKFLSNFRNIVFLLHITLHQPTWPQG